MSQTSYPKTLTKAFAGMLADDTPHTIRSYKVAADTPFGLGLVQDTADDAAKVPAASFNVFTNFLGVTVFSHAYDNQALTGSNGIPAKCEASLLRRGVIYVLPEQDVTPADAVFCRYTANGTGKDVGQFRKDADGVAQVETLTPTAVNSTGYMVEVDGRAYFYQSDSSATAAEIVTGLAAQITADTTAVVTPTGTTTLILTAKTAGVPFEVRADANLAIAHTTPNTARAQQVTHARWVETATATNPCKLEISLP